MVFFLDHVKISIVAWVGIVLSTEKQDKLNVPAWNIASLITSLFVVLMVNSMKTTVKCTGLPA